MNSRHLNIYLSAPAGVRQRGVTLVVALIFLAILTLLGVTAAQVVGLQERMAGNTRNRDLAFQAAEAVLNYVQNDIQTNSANYAAGLFSGSIAAPGSGGKYSWNICLPNSQAFWSGTGGTLKDCTGANVTSFNWSTANATLTAGGASIINVAQQPKYVVELMPNLGALKRYRVTVRAVGGDSNAVVILQAIYTST